MNKFPKFYTSIIIASYVETEERLGMFERSLATLHETVKHLPVEIIVVDNGSRLQHSRLLQNNLWLGSLVCVVSNQKNMSYGYARNQGFVMSQGNYVVIADNDIEYQKGWLDACLQFLADHSSEKFITTPLDYPMPALRKKYQFGELDGFKLSYRCGGNCMIMTREAMVDIGPFAHSRRSGPNWADKAYYAGYKVAVTPQDMVVDLGLRKGYNWAKRVNIGRILSNGEMVSFNED